MTFTFFSNFLNQIQKPFCDEMFKYLGDNFKFVSTVETPEIRLKSGYPDYSGVSYNVLAYKNSDLEKQSYLLAEESDIVMFGADSFQYVKQRIENNLLTINCSERFFKKSDNMVYNPRISRFMYRFHTRYRNKNLHLLCASAFAANDAKMIFAYPNKMYKWGYFTKLDELYIPEIIERKNQNSKIEIIWVARFIKWKHPELMVALALALKAKGQNFIIRMVGGGEEFKQIEKLIQDYNLHEHLELIGNIPNAEVLHKMRTSNIFCLTSDRNEGWGAVLNEAMSNGCAVVASSDIGAVPYLIKPGENGLVFKSNDIDSLTEAVEKLILDEELRNSLSINAYETMRDEWSPKIAATNLFNLSQSLLKGDTIRIENGPCSSALPTSKNWFKN